MLRTLYFVAIMLTAIGMSLGMAHFAELPNKIEISAAHYLIVQRNYDNWAVLGLIVPAAFLSVAVLVIALRGTGAPFALAVIALLLLVGELVAFWGFIFPVNQATQNWTMLPTCGRRCARNGSMPTRSAPFSMCSPSARW
jgi:hypothetical protein